MTTVNDVSDLADIAKFLKDTNADSIHGECHNALTWLAIQIKRADFECYNVHLCAGVFARQDHSWIEVKDFETETYVVIDMTVGQFGNELAEPYVGPRHSAYVVYDSILLSDDHLLRNFIEMLG